MKPNKSTALVAAANADSSSLPRGRDSKVVGVGGGWSPQQSSPVDYDDRLRMAELIVAVIPKLVGAALEAEVRICDCRPRYGW